jgi:hypothetical protein
MIFASVENGSLTLRNHDNTKRGFSFDDEGKAALAETLKEWGADPEDGVMCSSSVDFAEEYGAPDDLDVRDWIGKAQLMAAGPPPITFTIEQLEEMAKQLRDGGIEAVIERIERNVVRAKEWFEGEIA